VIINNRTHRTSLLASALFIASAWLCLSGCSKKPERETVPELTDTLSVTTDTLPAATDTLSVIFDTLTDTRDGKTYRTVKIGKQTWMAENLNYRPKTGKSWCYEDSSSYCKKYGRLYDWKTAKTVCPADWHLPSREEWDSLADYAGDKKRRRFIDRSDTGYYWPNAGMRLKSMSGWYGRDGNDNGNGTDEFGFSALPGGYYFDTNNSMDGKFHFAGVEGSWWTATEGRSGRVYNRRLHCNDGNMEDDKVGVGIGLSVRCVRYNAFVFE
jgi:uncharacterized protein (TIGR02145 family)